MSDYLDWLRQGTHGHAVEIKGRTITLTPRDDSYRALSDFQSVVDEVLRRSSAGEFKAEPYQSQKRPGNLYVSVVVRPIDE
jgi:hypothetical protein